MQILSLFAGIGGIDVGLEKLGWKTACYSEFDPKLKRQYAAEVMAARFPDAVHVGDVTELMFARNHAGEQGILRRLADGTNQVLFKGDIDVIAGGFPCQNVSLAGRGGGVKDGDRSGLWRNYAQAIEGLRPRGVLIENVAALAGRGLDIVLNDLARIGYDAEWDVISAAGVGAPHLRERMFIIAWPSGSAHHAPWPEPPCYSSWRAEPADVPRITMADIDQRVARLRCLGNAVVPQVAHHVGTILNERITGQRESHDHSSDSLHKSGELKGQAKYIGDAGHVLGTITDMKLPRAGRLTSGAVVERERSCTQKFAKARGLAKMAATLIGAGSVIPTPRASEWKGVGPIDSKSQAYRLEKGYLDAAMQDMEQATGRLNPDWVEWLMGFSEGWSVVADESDHAS